VIVTGNDEAVETLDEDGATVTVGVLIGTGVTTTEELCDDEVNVEEAAASGV
jgi:hypothetical protein